MTEEEKCCKCKENAKKFLFLSGGVFVGATLAILVSAALLKPKCPPPPAGFMPPRPGVERQLPPPPMVGGQPAPEFGAQNAPCPYKAAKAHKGHHGQFNPQQAPQGPQVPPAPPARPDAK